MNSLELEFENHQLKANAESNTAKLLEASIYVEAIKKENAALCKAITLILGDFQELKEDLHPETKERLRGCIDSFPEAIQESIKKLLNTEKEKVDLNEAAFDYVSATIKSLNN